MSQHRSLKGASTITAKRNVLKRFERVELLKKRGQWKQGAKVIGLPKTKPDAVRERLMRLNRFLAAAGLGSRRHCDDLIASGRVTINGQPCTNFSAQPTERDHVKVGGKLVRPRSACYLLLHKPAGFVSTRQRPARARHDLRFAAAEISAAFQRRPARCPDRRTSPPDERRRPRPAPHSSALQGGERIRGHARSALGSGADAEIIARDFSRRQTREDLALAAIWPTRVSRRFAAGNQPPDPPDVLRPRLRSEETRLRIRIGQFAPAAICRAALAPAYESAGNRPACRFNPTRRAESRAAARCRRRSSSASPIATVSALTATAATSNGSKRRRVGQFERQTSPAPSSTRPRARSPSRSASSAEKQIFGAKNFPDLRARRAERAQEHALLQPLIASAPDRARRARSIPRRR